MIMYALTVFLSAFLLFLVQPILAKYILPWFGGSPGVWNTCLLFFQVLLTAGYGLSHLLAQNFKPRRQVSAILALLLVTIAFLPITPAKTWLPESLNAPTWHILRLLAASVGACYFLLSSISPLMQSWFNRTHPDVSPYRLYTLSNIGSLLAIAGYPFVIEPNLGLGFQTKLWSALYLVFALLCALCALRQWNLPPAGFGGLPHDAHPAPPDLTAVLERVHERHRRGRVVDTRAAGGGGGAGAARAATGGGAGRAAATVGALAGADAPARPPGVADTRSTV